MASNVSILDGAGASQTVKTTDTAGVHTPHHNVDSSALPTGASTLAEQQSQTTAMQIMDDWDESDRAKVNPIVGQAGVAAGAGAVGATVPRVTLASDDPAVTALQTLDNAISGSEMQVDVVAALPAGTNNIGDVDVASIAAGTNTIGNVGSVPLTSGGLTIFKTLDLDETEEEVKGTAGQVYFIHAINLASTARYLKFYNATAANVIVGTTAPVATFPVPSAGSAIGAGFTVNIDKGLAFSTAITVAATTGIADADTGAPGANEVVVTIGYA